MVRVYVLINIHSTRARGVSGGNKGDTRTENGTRLIPAYEILRIVSCARNPICGYRILENTIILASLTLTKDLVDLLEIFLNKNSMYLFHIDANLYILGYI